MYDANARSARRLAGPSGTGEAGSLPLARGLLSWGGAQWGAASPETPVLLSDPEVSAVSVLDCGEPLTELGESFGPSRALVRASVARRLVPARDELPRRGPASRRRLPDGRGAASIISSYAAGLRIAHPAIGAAELERLTSRFVAPLAVAPHVAGAAVGLTLVDSAGHELDLGTPVDATPGQSEGACYFDVLKGTAPGPPAPASRSPGKSDQRVVGSAPLNNGALPLNATRLVNLVEPARKEAWCTVEGSEKRPAC